MTHRESPEWEQTYLRLRRNRTRRRKRLEWFDLPKQGLILDYGCGDGLNLEILHDLGYQRLVGIDVSADLLARVSNFRVVEGDGALTPFTSGSFDAVLVDSVLHHLDIQISAREIRRILRPGGRLCLVEPGGGLARRLLDRVTFSPLAQFVQLLRDRRESVREEWATYSQWLRQEAKLPLLLSEAGFTVLRIRREPLNVFVEAVASGS